MRVDLTPYAVAAFVLVVAAAVAAGGIAEAGRRWAAGLVRRSAVVAVPGLTALAVAVVNVFVARTCGPPPGARIRPVLAALSDGPCRTEAVVQLALVPAITVALTVVVRAVAGRRPHPHAGELGQREPGAANR